MGGSIAIGHPFGATGRAHRHDARERDAPARCAVRAGFHLRPGRDGQRPGPGAGLSACPPSTSISNRHRRRHARRARASRSTPCPRPWRRSSRRSSRGSESDPAVRAVVLVSGKPDNFIAGADIEEFTRAATAEEATRLSCEGQELMNRVAETLAKPVVAAIHGACLGGGLELALACHWRIATDHPKTQLGLPEVQLGIIPGAGGCQRLPRLIGARAALDMILAGKSERAAKASQLGLVDEVVPPAHPAARWRCAPLTGWRATACPARAPKRGLAAVLLDGTAPGRAPGVIAWRGSRCSRRPAATTPRRSRRWKPCGWACRAAWRPGLADERRAFGELAVAEVSRNLVRHLLRHDRAQEGRRGSARGSGPACTGAAASASSAPDSWARGSLGRRCSTPRSKCGCKDADLPGWARGSRRRPASSDDRLKRRRLTPPEYERLAALLSGSAD